MIFIYRSSGCLLYFSSHSKNRGERTPAETIRGPASLYCVDPELFRSVCPFPRVLSLQLSFSPCANQPIALCLYQVLNNKETSSRLYRPFSGVGKQAERKNGASWMTGLSAPPFFQSLSLSFPLEYKMFS